MEDLRAAVRQYLSDPTFRLHADDFYTRLVTEAPVLHVGPIWLISGYDEIQQLCRAPEATADPSAAGAPVALAEAPTLAAAMSLMLPMRDGEDHRRLKRLATAAFNARRVADAAGLVQRAIDDLLRPKLAEGSFDVVADLAVPLPVLISCALLEIPDEDRDRVVEWALAFRDHMCRFGQSPESVAAAELTAQDLVAYIRHLCDQRRAHPGTDLISQLSLATEDGRLDDDELVAFVMMLFVNGLETLTAGLTIATFELLARPQWCEAIKEDGSIAAGVFDDCLRLASPVRATSRALRGDVEVGGHLIPKQGVTVMLFAAANRDPRRFERPGEIDPHRSARHLAFGFGPHYCLGAALSLSAGGAVLSRLLRQCPELGTDLTRETAPWGESFVFNTLRSLPVTFVPTSAGDGATARPPALVGGR